MFSGFLLAWRYLFRGKAHHVSFIGVISCLGVALGVATLIVVMSVMNGFDRDLMDRLLRFNYHVNLESYDQDDLLEVKKTIDTWSEVKSSSIYLKTQVFAKLKDSVLPLGVKGVNFDNPAQKNQIFKYVTQELGDSGFFAGEGLRRRFGKDDNFEYYPLKKTLQAKEGKLRGYFKVGLYEVDNSYLITDLETAKSLSSNYAMYLGVRIDDPFRSDEIKERIKSSFDEYYFVTTWAEVNRVLFSALKLEKITMFIILSLIILVASFNIFATLTVRVIEKTKDIGVLKSIGFSSRRILTLFSLQGLFLGLIGVFSGITLGLGLSLFLAKYPIIKLPQEIYTLEYLPIHVNYPDVVLVGLVGMILAFICSLIPALRAAKLEACEALRYE